ncbi:MAG: hypothetical protein JRJ47_15255 [Deltaproteobacteria bacterium]|nr:hypothetical protein [Deltaproteobacteria bacterium]
MLEFDKNWELEASEFSGHTSSLEGNKYLNLSPANEPPGYIFTDAVEKGIDNGFLNGEVKRGKWSSSIHITEGQKELQQFILKNDKALFPETKYLQKLKMPDNPIK